MDKTQQLIAEQETEKFKKKSPLIIYQGSARLMETWIPTKVLIPVINNTISLSVKQLFQNYNSASNFELVETVML